MANAATTYAIWTHLCLMLDNFYTVTNSTEYFYRDFCLIMYYYPVAPCERRYCPLSVNLSRYVEYIILEMKSSSCS